MRVRGIRAWLRVAWRGTTIGGVTFGCLGLLLVVRLVERPIHGEHRPWTPHITQFVCRTALWLFGLRLDIRGEPLDREGAMVANHSSWLDIFVLNAPTRLYFVSKAEVERWPGIGWLARATGTVFIRRNRSEAAAQTALFEDRLNAGHRLLFFPEGTSTDGERVLPFKPTLFQAFLGEPLRAHLVIQPVSVRFDAPEGVNPRIYGWWGDMEFGEHLLGMLALPRHGRVTVMYHDPVPAADFEDRKVLAATLEEQVRAGHAALAEARDKV
ncbi:acyl-phosphate glycerol 3-phosphate acyltransferase [Pseudaestuariivita atlantica]|uniref:Acyl-phosphate glycerol 3-phosphate acyltransferase n=2 Tax=Pseudaestuariivita atlantica TaxID=1317121 RepID=A0A0L1JTC9_9RHOB|nr:acyl-phosphate glycerol 3-phosphate acyltransferase [Pseudaestuariivita atlantica]